MGKRGEDSNREKEAQIMNYIPFLLIISLNLLNIRFKLRKYDTIDGHDVLCVIISLVGCYTLS